VDLRIPSAESHTVRVINCHQNVPGVLKHVNKVLSEFNIEKQICDSRGGVAYLMADLVVEKESDLKRIYDNIIAMPENIVTRVLY